MGVGLARGWGHAEGERDWQSTASCSLARFYVNNRRDGSRLLSSALVIAGAGLVRIDHPIGRVVALVAGSISLYWWLCYRQLQS